MTDLEIIKILKKKLVKQGVDLKEIAKDDYSKTTIGYLLNIWDIPEFEKRPQKKTVTRLKITGTEIEEIPDEIFMLSNLEYLDLSNNKISFIPDSFNKLSNNTFGIYEINFSANNIYRLPELSNEIILNKLNFSENKIKEIPNSFFLKIKAYIKHSLLELDFSHNQLITLPTSITKFTMVHTAENRKIAYDDVYNSNFIDLSNNPIKYPSKNLLDKGDPEIILLEYYKFLEENSSDDILNSKKNELKNCIKQFRIVNFWRIIDLHVKNIPIDTQWIFLTGENGYGKTTILKGIVALLNGRRDINKFIVNAPNITNKYDNSFIEFKNDTNNLVNSIDNKFFTVFNKFAAYGAYRTHFSVTGEEINRTDNLFNKNDNAYIFDFERRYKDWKIYPTDNKIKIENFEKILSIIIPNLSRIDIDKKTSNVIYYEKSEDGEEYKPIIFSQLAMGIKSTIGIIADFLMQLSDKEMDFKIIKNKIQIEGIVIIDEFDNHLHPKWQKDLVINLSELFPKVQFIVSTHSPIPLLGAPKNSVIIKVNRTKEDGITAEKLDIDVSTLTPNSILTSPIFGFENLISSSKPNDKFINTEDDYKDISRKQKMRKEISEYLTPERTERMLNLLNLEKCAYCETKYLKNSDNWLEHYRPKSQYYWLAYEWSNLIPTCTKCNRIKKAKFPIIDENYRVEFPIIKNGKLDKTKNSY